MKERPILFSGPMVRAILDGTKTQTRRIIKSAKHPFGHWLIPDEIVKEFLGRTCAIRCPYGIPGDRIWVRETWAPERDGTGCPDDTGILYRATDPGWDNEETGLRWRPSIHMPRAASRILLEITDVRVERLQNITPEDCRAEGHPAEPWRSDNQEVHDDAACDWFSDLWIEINGLDSWNSNPWVWVVSFKRLKP
jgi:hypothetical protein